MSRSDALEIFNAGVEAVKPGQLLPQYLQADKDVIHVCGKEFSLDIHRNIYLLSLGKAASAMALEAEKILDKKITDGLVITKYHHAIELSVCKTIEAGHPLPDSNSVKASVKLKQLLRNVTEHDLVIILISGGASALLTDTPPGLLLKDIQQTNQLLLQCGATIHEINIIRKHLSLLKGGQLIRYTNNATVVSLILSDVPGDDPDIIASGLTVADNSSFADAKRIVEYYNLENKLPSPVIKYLQNGLMGKIADTPKPGNELFKKTHSKIIGNNRTALHAAMNKAKELGYYPFIINDNLHGEADEKAKEFVQEILQYRGPLPACLLMGGETTVTIKSDGKGGRNHEVVLAALCELVKQNIVVEKFPVILSAGTDGTDGPTNAAGAMIDKSVFNQVKKITLHPENYLQRNDAYHFFKQVNGLIVTGPTQTNVMDIVVGLINN